MIFGTLSERITLDAGGSAREIFPMRSLAKAGLACLCFQIVRNGLNFVAGEQGRGLPADRFGTGKCSLYGRLFAGWVLQQ